MSNSFVGRLVARNAGEPAGPGIAVLTPRPVSRFESPLAMNVETAATEFDGVPDDADLEVSSETPARIGKAAPHEGAIKRPGDGARDASSRPEEVSDVVDRTGLENRPPAIRRLQPFDEAIEMGPAPVQQDARPRDGRTSDSSHSDRRASAALAASASEPTTDVPIEERALRPAVPHASAVHRDIPPALGSRQPMISIGRIEVQFLPQELRAPTPRIEPPRTRGFEGYARARRGEPR